MSPRRSKAIAAIVALAAALGSCLGESMFLSGWSLDNSLTLRHWLFGDRYDVDRSPVVVLAIDEATFEHPSYREQPMALWGPQFADALNALDGAGAAIVGVDIIPSTTAETIAPGHDRPLMAALQRLGSKSRLILARADFANRSVAPHPAFAFVAGNGNIRSVNVPLDRDGITRRVPLWVGSPDEPTATFAAEIARRAGAQIGDPSPNANSLINFADRAIAPTYSLAEFTTCLQNGATEELSKTFGQRIVLLGATLDIEDRKSVSGRGFVDGAAGFRHLDCARSASAPAPTARHSLPGVFVLAQVINDLLRGDKLSTVGTGATAGIATILAAVGGFLGWRLGWSRGGLATLALLAVWILAAGLAIEKNLVLPMAGGSLALVGAFVLVFGFKALLVEREKRRLAHALGRYLDEKVALQLLSDEHPIELGGEMREITIWFSDIAGFSTIAEGLAPKELVRRLNAHFTIMAEAIEAEGGIIDKFVGDAVVAVFGAPQRLSDHAARALRAATQAISRLRADSEATGGFHVRIGINTGAALVGNVGSNRRFDYTVIGDAVNLAQRLEAANKEHGTTILISKDTALAAGDGFDLRPVGEIAVKGRASKVEAFELRVAEMPGR